MSDSVILLVEDNPDDEELTRLAFAQANIRNPVVVARDGVEALDYLLAENAQRPALVLLDLKLPRLSGLEVLQRIRQEVRTRTLPVVILTSSAEEDDLFAGLQPGLQQLCAKSLSILTSLCRLRGNWACIGCC